MMKKLLMLLPVLVIVGCAVPDPTSPGKYVVDPRVESTSEKIRTGAQVLAPLNPYAAITNPLIEGGLALLAVVSGLWARHKSGVANVMAAGIAKAGSSAVKVVLDHASDTSKYAAVAETINQHAAPDQSIH